MNATSVVRILPVERSDSETGVRRPSISRGAVVDAAEELLAGGGFDALSVRQLAQHLGSSRQVVYTHFDGVDGLFDALHERASSYLAAAVANAEGAIGTVDHMVAATRAYVLVARRHPDLYRLAFEQPVPDYAPSDTARRAGRASFGHVVVAADAFLHDPATAVADEPPSWPPASIDLARAAWTASHGFVVLERAGYATADETDRLAATAVRSMLAGWPRPGGGGDELLG